MQPIPVQLKADILADPYYKTCARKVVFDDHECQGRITFEHVIIFAGRQLNRKFAIIPLCEFAHSVGQFQNVGILDKEINLYIAINRATDEELKKISGAVDYQRLKKYLNKKYKEAIERAKIRTTQQNKAMHVYFTMVAEALNDAGLTVEEVIKHYRIELHWTDIMVKELIWKTAQRSMLKKESTTELRKQKEIDLIWEVVNRFLAKLKVESIAFPSIEEIMSKQRLLS